MKFDIIFLLQGPAGIVQAPNTKNPVEAKSMGELLIQLAPHIPNGGQLGINCVGLEIKVVPEPKEYVLERGNLRELNERDQSDAKRSTTVIPAPQIHTPGQSEPPPNPPKWTPPMCN